MRRKSRLIRVDPEFESKLDIMQKNVKEDSGLKLTRPDLTRLLANNMEEFENYLQEKKKKKKQGMLFRFLK